MGGIAIMTVNERIKETRQNLDMTQKQFAERIAVSISYLSDMERSDSKVNDRVIRLVSMEFGISEHWIRTGEGGMYSDFSAVRLAKMTSLFKTLPPKPQELAIALLSTLIEHHNANND
jgi:transcriptional regulator with XRE-family HTH domain